MMVVIVKFQGLREAAPSKKRRDEASERGIFVIYTISQVPLYDNQVQMSN